MAIDPADPPAFSLAATIRHRLDLIGSHADTVPLHLFRLSVPPGVPCEPELRQLADDLTLAVHRAGQAAARGGTAHERTREAYIAAIAPVLREHLRLAEAIEGRRATASKPGG